MDRRSFISGIGASLGLASLPSFIHARDGTPPASVSDGLEAYYWQFSKADTWIFASLAFFDDEDIAEQVAYKTAHRRMVTNRLEKFEEIENHDLGDNIRAFEGIVKRENRTIAWRDVTMYVGYQDNRGVAITFNGDESDAYWVLMSLLKDGQPVTPFEHELIKYEDFKDKD